MNPEKDDIPENCPECGSIDYIELKDERTGTTEMVCLDCGFFLRWRIEEGIMDWEPIIALLRHQTK
jgi:transcription initiation factor TFIIIB Brf1 subunit/transcription initiation factor TFIIB